MGQCVHGLRQLVAEVGKIMHTALYVLQYPGRVLAVLNDLVDQW
jgi:hypothetical protein